MVSAAAAVPALVLAPLPLLAATPLAPVLILVLCVLAGIGTVLALPSSREASFRSMGAVLLTAAGLILSALLVHAAAGPSTAARGGMGAYFWIFSAIALIGAVRVITHPRPVYSALYFVMTVMASAGLFVLLWAEFMAAALVLIYAGAILVTYVFVIMLASQAGSALAEYDATSREPLAACSVGFLLMGVLLLVIFDRAPGLIPQSAQAPAGPQAVAPGAILLVEQTSTRALGEYLFRNQVVNLELAGIILTVAMVGAILITRRRVLPKDQAFEEPEPVGPEAPAASDDPHALPISGTTNPRQKEYPEH